MNAGPLLALGSERLEEFLRAGGPFLWPLLLVGLILWTLLAGRVLTLWGARLPGGPLAALRRARSQGPPAGEGLAARCLRAALGALKRGAGAPSPDRALAPLFLSARLELARHRGIVRSLTAVGPLLGLLGTVSGMIETFASLPDMAFFSASGGISGGISEALLTTQLGLFVAIPGLLLGRYLERRERDAVDALERLRRLLAAAAQAGAL